MNMQSMSAISKIAHSMFDNVVFPTSQLQTICAHAHLCMYVMVLSYVHVYMYAPRCMCVIGGYMELCAPLHVSESAHLSEQMCSYLPVLVCVPMRVCESAHVVRNQCVRTFVCVLVCAPWSVCVCVCDW